MEFCGATLTTASATKEKHADAAPDMDPAQAMLRDWSARQSDACRMDAAIPTSLPANACLKLAYIGIEVLTYRQMLHFISLGTSTEISTIANCLAMAKDCFVQAVDFIQNLSPTQLCSFWYQSSAGCCAMVYDLGRMLTSCLAGAVDRSDCLQKLRGLIWALKVNSEGSSSFCKRGLSMIRAVCEDDGGAYGRTTGYGRSHEPSQTRLSGVSATMQPSR